MNHRGLITQAIIALLSLSLAYAVWSRSQIQRTPTGPVVVEGSLGNLRRVELRHGTDLLVLEPKEGPTGHYVEVTSRVKGGAPERCRGNRVAEHLLKGFAPLLAVRALGVLPPDKLRQGGLTDSLDSLTIQGSRGGTRLILGSETVGGEGRRAFDPDSRMVYVISIDQLPQPGAGLESLFETSLHSFAYTDATSLLIAAGGNRAEAVQFFEPAAKRSYWRWKWQKELDGFLSNWLDTLHRTRATMPSRLGIGEPIVTLTYRRHEKQLGYLKIWRVADFNGRPAYVGATEQSLGAVRLGSQIHQVLDDLPRMMATAVRETTP